MRDILLAKDKTHKIRGERDVTKIQDWQDDEVLFEYCKNPALLKHVQAFIGDSVRSIHTMLINKPPDLGKGTSCHPMHQDLLYFPMRPANRIVAAWTALQKITVENGCLSVIPGSHLHGLKGHGIPDVEVGNMMYQGVKNIDPATASNQVFLEMDAGDTVFFHPCLIHGSGPNNSDGFRKAISCHYASGKDCVFTAIPSHNYSLLNELYDTVSKKSGGDLTLTDEEKLALYQMGWKMKSRQLIGEENDGWEL